MMSFNKHYFGLAILIFVIEILIALFVHDDFVRPYLGDVLVVILIYCILKSFLRLQVLTVAIFVLIFAFAVEFLQFINIVDKLGLEKSRIVTIIIGTSFSWIDLLSYVAGIAIVLIVEKVKSRKIIIHCNLT